MNARLRLGLGILAVSLLLGVLGDLLLRATPWGINAFLWICAAVAAATWLARSEGAPLNRQAAGWIFPLLLSAACFFWRDSAALRALNLLAIALCLSMTLWLAHGGTPFLAGITDHLLRFIVTVLHTAFGAFAFLAAWVFRENPVKEALSRGWFLKAAKALTGVLLALPILTAFAALFVSADAVYRHYVVRALDVNFEELALHILFTATGAWLVAGYLRALLWRSPRPPIIHPGPASRPFGSIEINVVLALLNALFLSFIVVQLRYLFGGSELVIATAGLTYAEYARKGFFELVTVAALLLPLLLAADWLLEGAPDKRVFRLQAASLGAMLVVIMASALKRMMLYQGEYGLTELRLYTTAFMGWLALALAWFAATVLRGRREPFAGGALAAGFAVFFGLHAANPDDLIARTNLAHFRAGKPFDAGYAVTLSGDAVPALAAALNELPPDAATLIRVRMLEPRQTGSADWRNWNLARKKAHQLARNATLHPAQPAARVPVTIPSVRETR